MHEMALAQSIVDIVIARSADESFRRTLAIHLRIGALAGVDPAALEFGFAAASRGTVAEGAALVIERPIGKAFCAQCGTNIEVNSRADPCPRCASYEWLLLEGDDMRVTELEVE